LKQNHDFFVYLGYGTDCAVFNPTFDQAFLSYLPDISLKPSQEDLDITTQLDEDYKRDV